LAAVAMFATHRVFLLKLVFRRWIRQGFHNFEDAVETLNAFIHR
jgi:hypothetical protein